MRYRYPEDIEELARACGYSWPEDEKQRVDVLIGIARTVRHWRERSTHVYRERVYRHMSKRLTALATKLRNVRKAAAVYKSGQNYAAYERGYEQGIKDASKSD